MKTNLLALVLVLFVSCSAQFTPLPEVIARRCNYDLGCINKNPSDANIYAVTSPRNNTNVFYKEEDESGDVTPPWMCPFGMYPTAGEYMVCRQFLQDEFADFTMYCQAVLFRE
jgi:hypothetical protein